MISTSLNRHYVKMRPHFFWPILFWETISADRIGQQRGGGVTFSWTKNEISYVETLRENESPFIIFHHFLTYNTLYMEVLWNAYYIKQNVSTKLWLFSTFYRRNKILSDSSVILFLIRQLGVMEFWYAVKGIKIFLVLALITIKMLLGIKYHAEHGFK